MNRRTLLASAAGATLAALAASACGGDSTPSAPATQATERVVAAEQDDDPNLPGVWIDPGVEYPDSAPHVPGAIPFCEGGVQRLSDAGRATCYTSDPPTSGPHALAPARWVVFPRENPIQKETFVHNLEHGGVVILYNCSTCTQVDELEEIARRYLDEGRLLLMSPYPNMEGNTIALLGWSRLDLFSVEDYSESRAREFIEEHERRFNPERF